MPKGAEAGSTRMYDLFTGAVEDPGIAAAMCRAYNRRLAD
jgi:hypothetical protein